MDPASLSFSTNKSNAINADPCMSIMELSLHPPLSVSCRV